MEALADRGRSHAEDCASTPRDRRIGGVGFYTLGRTTPSTAVKWHTLATMTSA
jgi:hypothetical protein